MPNTRLLQAGIVIASFFILVTAFQTFAISFIFFAFEVFTKDGGQLDFTIQTILIYFLLFLVALFIQKKSGEIAEWIGDRSGTGNQVQVQVSYPAVFSVILVSFSIYQLMGLLPQIGSWIYESFRSKIDRNEFLNLAPTVKIYWPDLIIRIAMYVLIILYAKKMGTWFSWSFHQAGNLEVGEEATEVNPGLKPDQP